MNEATEQEMLNQPKEQVIDRQFKYNCDYGYKMNKVNQFIRMAFESGFENGVNYQKFSQTTPEYLATAQQAERVKELEDEIERLEKEIERLRNNSGMNERWSSSSH